MYRKFLVILAALIGFAGLSSPSFAGDEAAPNSQAPKMSPWQLRCPKVEGALPCDLYQAVADKASGRQVLSVSIAYSAVEDKYLMQIQVPLGINLQQGLSLNVGENFQASHIPLTRCEASGCLVEAIMADDLLAAMKEADGSEAEVIVLDYANQPASLPFSLMDFDAVVGLLRQQSAPQVTE
ncbi:MAG: hypothetical protein EP347_00305 [Alphaproteobacteria bacterium]|nr:MAG: hypothetical protein EP347_00305 [Alphaproteobacteria bacterium]